MRKSILLAVACAPLALFLGACSSTTVESERERVIEERPTVIERRTRDKVDVHIHDD